eukprot:1834441-Amphidinium_carterae.1
MELENDPHPPQLAGVAAFVEVNGRGLIGAAHVCKQCCAGPYLAHITRHTSHGRHTGHCGASVL